MYSMFFRTTVMFFIVMFSLRIMGKKNLGEFQPSDLVATILISNLTSMSIESPEMPMIFTISPILLIMCYEVFISVAVKKSDKIAALAQGKYMILVKNGIINQKVMQQLRFTVDDILEAMRSKDIFYLEEVNLAIVETTGAVNIYPDPNVLTNIKKAKVPPFAVIIDGKYCSENMEYANISKEKVADIIEKENIDVNRVLLLLIDGNGRYNLTIKEKIWDIL